MVFKIKIFLLLIIVAIIQSCSAPTAELNVLENKRDYLKGIDKENTKFDLKILIGSWEDVSNKNSFHENWTATNDSTFSGLGYELLDNDTVNIEKLSLFINSNNSRFGALVSSANDYVWFEEVESNLEKIVFENKMHDFPQRIIYSKKSNDEITARIEGEINDSLHYYDYHYIRN